MSKNFIGLLPSGKAPSTLKAEIIEMVKTEAPAPDLSGVATKEELETALAQFTPTDLSGVATKEELETALAQFTPAEELANRVATLETGAANGGIKATDNGNGTVTLTL